MDWLQGRKTYISAIALVIYALLSVYLGKETWDQAIGIILGASATASLRSALTNTILHP